MIGLICPTSPAVKHSLFLITVLRGILCQWVKHFDSVSPLIVVQAEDVLVAEANPCVEYVSIPAK